MGKINHPRRGQPDLNDFQAYLSLISPIFNFSFWQLTAIFSGMRVAIVGGCRTAFVRAGGKFNSLSFLDLGMHSVSCLTKKLGISQFDELAYSTVLLDPRYPNFAREIILRTELPDNISAHSVSNNCISGLVAVNFIAEGIRAERIKSGIAGGSESMSNPALYLSRKAEKMYLDLSRAKSWGERLKVLSRFRPDFIFPRPPSPKEPSTGLTMGQHCEITAKEFNIAREAQDRLALKSHKSAASAGASGYLAEEIVELDGVKTDDLIRADTSFEKLSKLKPVFDRSDKGTLTAGNSSALTDGASAICLMSEDEANRQGMEVLGYLEACEYAAIAPADGLLMAPGLALANLFKKNGLSVQSVDRFEIHEAFAAQVLANLKVWQDGWAKYPDLNKIGEIPAEKINVNGGSIAIGHPFAATGGRLILSSVNELKRNNLKTAVISVCAAGAMACAMLIKRP